MIKSETVFVIGAGASAEVGLPVGSGLTRQIAKLLHTKFENGSEKYGDAVVGNAISAYVREHPTNASATRLTCAHIADAMPLAPSIDNFIDNHNDKPLVSIISKIGIVRSILQAERSSRLWFTNNNIYNTISFGQLSDNWYIRLWRLLCTEVDTHSVKDIFRHVTFIVFNYDRCLEHFLAEALRVYYRLDNDTISDIMDSARFYHPYGQVGALPPTSRSDAVPYGGDVSPPRLLQLIEGIKTFTERVEEGEQLQTIRNTLVEARKLVFLGFAYHDINMRLIAANAVPNNLQVFGTSFMFSQSDMSIIKQKIKAMFVDPERSKNAVLHHMDEEKRDRIRIDLLPKVCVDLFTEYSLSIG